MCHFNGATGFEQVNDPQTKITLSKGLDIIASNVLKGVIRHYSVNDTDFREGGEAKYIIVYLQDLELLYPILLVLSHMFIALSQQNYPTTSRCSHATYKELQMVAVQGRFYLTKH